MQQQFRAASSASALLPKEKNKNFKKGAAKVFGGQIPARAGNLFETKIYEVEEYQDFQFVPVTFGPAMIIGAREIGVVKKGLSRKMGAEVFSADDPRLQDVELDGI